MSEIRRGYERATPAELETCRTHGHAMLDVKGKCVRCGELVGFAREIPDGPGFVFDIVFGERGCAGE